LWTGVAVFLTYRGVSALLELSPPALFGGAALALIVGIAKGLYVLKPAALRSAARILERGDDRCLGGFLSWKTWLFVVGMMGFGKYLRSAGLPPWFIGPLLTAVGTGLFVGSTIYWVAWKRHVLRDMSGGF
jgi:hypothetical protein